MMNSKLRICAIVPTHNNAGTIVDVLRRIQLHLQDVIIVLDGCTDGTESLIDPSTPRLSVVKFPVNKGKGSALKAGFKEAQKRGFDYAVTIDADGQHFPEDLPLLIEAIEQNPGAMIVGSRNLQSENMPSQNTFANKFSNFWFHLQTTSNLPDTQTGFRAYPLNSLPWLGLITSRYEAELEMLVLMAWRGVKLLPIPIRVFYQPVGERVSSFRPFWDFFRISVLNVVLCLLAIVYGYPRMILNKLRG